MKKQLLIGLCAAGIALVSIPTRTSAVEVKNVITRTFPVSASSVLKIDNTFGDVVIAPGKRSEIDFRIEITGTGLDQQTAQRMADRATVSLHQSGNTVTARTSLGSSLENCNNCTISVDYLVLVPSSVYLDLTNKFGNINIKTDVQHDLKVNLQYGNLTANRLQDGNNHISLKFGNMTLDNVNAVTAECSYGQVKINRANSVDLNLSFCILTTSSIDELNLSTKYSDITVENLGALTGSSSFSNVNISNLEKRCHLSNVMYGGGVRINKCSPQVESIRIQASYCGVTVGLPTQISARATLYTHFGKIHYSGLKVTPISVGTEEDKNVESFQGTIGPKSAHCAEIEISNRYADITLKP